MSFGREIRRRREAVGWTIEELAERAGLSPNYIGTVENGRRDPSLSTILALAKGLRVPAGELLGGTRELSPAGCEVGRLFDAATPEGQRLARDLLLALRKRR